MIRDLELAFVKLHFLYHADNGEVFGVGLIEELARHGHEVARERSTRLWLNWKRVGF